MPFSLTQYWNTVDFKIWNKFQFNLKRNPYIFIQENAFQNIVSETSAFLLGLDLLKYDC